MKNLFIAILAFTLLIPQLNAANSQASKVTAKTVIANYVKAIGGVARLKAVKTVVTESETQMSGMTIKMYSYSEAPNKSCVEFKLGAMSLERKFWNGTKGGSIVRGVFKPIDGSVLASMKDQSVIFPETNYTANGYTLKLDGIESVNGKDAYKVMMKKEGMPNTVNYFDVVSGLKVKKIETNDGKETTVLYSDYKEFKGIKFPTIENQIGKDAKDAISIRLTNVQINVAIDESLFEK